MVARDADSRAVDTWRRVFDLVYRRPVTEGDDLRGWDDPLTGAPLPATDIAEWLDETVGRILVGRPRHLVEVGAGTGNLALRLAPRVDRYVGTDVSSVALQQLAARARRAGLTNVAVVQGAADELAGAVARSAGAGADTVVLNSVCQYFPSLGYAERALRQAIDLVGPGGRVFVGDVPHGPLMAARAAAFRRAPERRELAPAPSFFRAVAGRAGWQALPLVKVGDGRNVLNLFRYDVVVAPAAPRTRPGPRPATQLWAAVGLPGLAEGLRSAAPGTLVLTGVPDARLDPGAEGACTPGAIVRSAAGEGWAAVPVWPGDGAEGRYAVACTPAGAGDPIVAAVAALGAAPGETTTEEATWTGPTD